MHYYLIHIQYLGFRFHGWQRQPGVKTVESMVVKTLEFILGHNAFKILGTSRTDAMVSAMDSAFELFTEDQLVPDLFLQDLNRNFPPDIRAMAMEEVGPEFNILNSPRTKEYHYFFCRGEKFHPFCAPFMAWIPGDLDVSLMKEGALLFNGEHNFCRYCTKPSENTSFVRQILKSRIEENNDMKDVFFPGQSWVYKVTARGFMRHQVRLMMGQLIALGRGQVGMDDIRNSLTGCDTSPLKTIAPASGLILHKVTFHDR